LAVWEKENSREKGTPAPVVRLQGMFTHEGGVDRRVKERRGTVLKKAAGGSETYQQMQNPSDTLSDRGGRAKMGSLKYLQMSPRKKGLGQRPTKKSAQ